MPAPSTARLQEKVEQTIQVANARKAVRSSYHGQKDALWMKDFYKWLETCYNTYIDGSASLVDKDTRLSLLDQALTIKKVKDYFDRQVS